MQNATKPPEVCPHLHHFEKKVHPEKLKSQFNNFLVLLRDVTPFENGLSSFK